MDLIIYSELLKIKQIDITEKSWFNPDCSGRVRVSSPFSGSYSGNITFRLLPAYFKHKTNTIFEFSNSNEFDTSNVIIKDYEPSGNYVITSANIRQNGVNSGQVHWRVAYVDEYRGQGGWSSVYSIVVN